MLYDQICQELRVEVWKDGEVIEDDSSAVVKRLLRLVQVASTRGWLMNHIEESRQRSSS